MTSALTEYDLTFGDQIVGSLHAAALQGDPERLFDLLDGMAVTTTRDIENLRKRQAVCMWLAEMVWDRLPLETTTQWSDFYGWCRERLGYRESSARNLIRACRVYYNPSLQLPERVTLHGRDGERLPRSVNPDVYDVPISKLVLTSSAFEEGRLTDVQLGQVFNKDVPWGVLAESLRDQKLLMAGNPVARFYMEGPHLIIVEDGVSREFGTLDIYSEEPLIQKGVRHVLLAAGVLEP